MPKRYLLDTNAYFNYLRVVQANHDENSQYSDAVKNIKEGNPCISVITKVEIISVLGKYARGNNGGMQQCNCIISEDGQRCTNTKFVKPRKRWKNKKIKAWRKLVGETIGGESSLISLKILPFDLSTICEAEKIAELSLIHSFASMDALIAATAKQKLAEGEEIVVVTSDKALKICLDKCSIPYWDAFPIAPVSES